MYPAEKWTPECWRAKAQRVRLRCMRRGRCGRSGWRGMPGAVMLLEAADEAGARALVESLPLAKLRKLEFVMAALEPYPGFGPR